MNLSTITIPLTKIDVEKRLVFGIAAAEIKDQSGEVMDYATARPAFESWSQQFQDATGGLSKGNVRVMHTKVVAGRLDQIGFDDEKKHIEVCAKVVDDGEWRKCLDGVYTGFSVGGGYGPRWTDGDGNKRYTPIVREISLVDNPCIPTARFVELVKAHGVVEQMELRGAPLVSFADAWAARPQSFAEQWLAKGSLLREGATVLAGIGSVIPGTTAAGNYRALGFGKPRKPRQPKMAGAATTAQPAPMAKAFDEAKHKRDHGKFSAEFEDGVKRGVGNVGALIGAGAALSQGHRIENFVHSRPLGLTGLRGGLVSGAGQAGAVIAGAYVGRKAGAYVGHKIDGWLSGAKSAPKKKPMSRASMPGAMKQLSALDEASLHRPANASQDAQLKRMGM